VDEGEPDILADGVKAPDLADSDVVVLTKSPRDVYHARGYIQVKWDAQAAERHPFGQRFEVVDRLGRFDLHDRLKTSAPLG
jgi:hypothetical protein